jgi:aminoacyl tRNA synthase complex-interacting multifunctional protein 1
MPCGLPAAASFTSASAAAAAVPKPAAPPAQDAKQQVNKKQPKDKKAEKKAEKKGKYPSCAVSFSYLLLLAFHLKDKPKNQEPAGDAAPIDVSRLDMRIGFIVHAKKHPDADGLYVEEVDVGEDKPRTIVSGLVKHIPLDQVYFSLGNKSQK